MKKKIAALHKMAHESLEAAEKLFADGYYGFAAARAYYALFYISEALLATKNLSFSKHHAVISAVAKNFTLTGDLPQSYHHTLHVAFQLRTIGDYWTEDKEVSKEKAEETLLAVKSEIQVGLELLKKLS